MCVSYRVIFDSVSIIDEGKGSIEDMSKFLKDDMIVYIVYAVSYAMVIGTAECVMNAWIDVVIH